MKWKTKKSGLEGEGSYSATRATTLVWPSMSGAADVTDRGHRKSRAPTPVGCLQRERRSVVDQTPQL